MSARRARALGLALLAALGVLGAGLLALAARAGAPVWPAGAFAALAVVALALSARRPSPAAARPLAFGAESAILAELRRGDLVRAAAASRGEGLPAELAAAVAGATAALARVADEVREANVATASTADGVARITADLASGSAELSASVVEITAAMEELARTAAEIAGRAATQAELAARAEGRGVTGASALADAVSGVAEVKARIGAIAARTDALGARTKEIGRVLDLIEEIAQETHVLSLNAAIEAAAAGEGGRRIAVVAEEVRHLASRSRDSVASVRALLDEFAGAIRGTVVATEEGSKETERVLERARRAAAAIGDLREVASETAERARRISGATREQNVASDEVVATLRDVGRVVQRASQALEGLDGTAARIERQVLSLELLTQGLRRDSPRSLKHLSEEWAAQLRDLPHQELQRELDRLFAASPSLDCAYFVDAKGYTLALSARRPVAGPGLPSEAEVLGRDLSGRPWFTAAARSGRACLTSPYASVLGGRVCWSVAVPIAGPDGALAGVLGLDVEAHGWTRT